VADIVSIGLSADQQRFVALLTEKFRETQAALNQRLRDLTEARDLFCATILEAHGVTKGTYKLNASGTALVPVEQEPPKQSGGEP